jgi:hypothetical protein
VAVLLDEYGFVSALEEMPDPAVPFVEKLGVDAVQLSHAEGEIAVRSLDEEVIVIGHEAVGVANPIVAFINVLESIQEVLAVLVILKDRLLFVPAGGYMIDCAGIFYAERAGHDETLA